MQEIKGSMQWSELGQEPCSVARTLSVIGDRWTLLVLLDCFLKVRRFEDFQRRLRIGRPILASRLQKLVDNHVLVKVPYQERPLRYEYRLTDKGLDLYPILMSILRWGDVHMPSEQGPARQYRHKSCGELFHPVQVCSECGEPVDARQVQVEVGPGGCDPARLPLVATAESQLQSAGAAK